MYTRDNDRMDCFDRIVSIRASGIAKAQAWMQFEQFEMFVMSEQSMARCQEITLRDPGCRSGAHDAGRNRQHRRADLRPFPSERKTKARILSVTMSCL